MRLSFWRRVRFLLRGTKPRRSSRVPIRGLAFRGTSAGDALVDALLDLRRVVEAARLEDLPLAWFRVDEAKASAAWYDPAREPAYAAVLPEEQALAEKLHRTLTGRPVTAASLIRPSHDPLPMVRFRLL
ncbi:MAG: hypothetical protein HUU35_16975, partial [Armatimonadetes bacterium]|nr:hypothetical protein [Armatimonadota bacterium]